MNKKCFTLMIIIILLSTLNTITFSQNSKPENSHNNSPQKELTKEDKEYLKKATFEGINHLEDYIKKISNKSKKLDIREGLIKVALELFVNNGEKTTVEVSSVNSKLTKTYKTKEYFWNLATINYAQVQISFAHTYFVSDFKLRADRKYEGIVSIEQTFTGTPKSREFSPYKDVTKKNIKVVAEKIDVVNATSTTSHWRIFFDNIKVTETDQTGYENKKK